VSLDLALEYACSHEGKYRLAALAYDAKGRLLSVGLNSYGKTHPMQARYAMKANWPGRIYLHAEIHALIKAKAPVHSLFVARARKDGTPALAKPCPLCHIAIQEAGVRILHHT
jgi:tRNA(Arg) A34 adenosine deaminase TadA